MISVVTWIYVIMKGARAKHFYHSPPKNPKMVQFSEENQKIFLGGGEEDYRLSLVYDFCTLWDLCHKYYDTNKAKPKVPYIGVGQKGATWHYLISWRRSSRVWRWISARRMGAKHLGALTSDVCVHTFRIHHLF